ncbi:lysophospholipid acyltransferase family protein [Cellulosilyticum ruminicola]|uniref:lysophospholipid acyltransferase family protein n=1 Tax=Cellulosilyticum ruminicola TaxID=425254 RepID=UPI0006CF46BF|nr:lysophospholipid acyltransferase family protein [Cellulosilyticum ruminicola]
MNKRENILLNDIRMLWTMGSTHLMLSKKRNEYAYGNKKYSIRKSREEIYKQMQLLCKKMIKSAKMDLQVMGKENLPKEGPVLYVANHKGIFDIVSLVSTIDDPCIYIAKKEVGNMMLINTWFDALGAIYIDREDKRGTIEKIIKGIDEIKQGQSIVVFPEGTRVSGNEIKEFKGGVFKLAIKTGVPIVPIAIHNTHKVFEEKRGIQTTRVTLNIGKPIEVKDLSKEDIKVLPKLTEDIVRELFAEIINQSQLK